MDDGSPAVIVYSTAAPVDPAALDALCAAVGWPPRPAPAVAAALAGSYLVASLLLRPAAGAGGGGATLVGLARATSDGAFNATIWDVLVHPAWQGRGLGKDLVERVAATLLDAGISNVTLFADAAALPFYEGLGFEADPEGIRGMFYAGK
jgi:GNAT superfamily N-acetyltransferase